MKVSLFFSILALSVGSCSNDPKGSNGDAVEAYVPIVNQSGQASVEDCPNGGITLDYGVDQNGNGELEASEVSDTYVVCNGEDGAAGSETDPVFGASEAATITPDDTANWDAAYGWGDHAGAGYLTDEADPVYGASEAAGITATDVAHWNTAYDWGDHSAEGYITDDTSVPKNHLSAAGALGFTWGTTELASAVMAEGEDVSLLNNDAGYLTSSDNVSVLANDAGYVAYARTIVVHPTPGNPTTSGADLLAAMAAAAGATSNDPYLVKLEPGIYDLGSDGLTMIPFVDIEGSGETTTMITSARSYGAGDENAATVTGCSWAELRFLTVENTGGTGAFTIGIYAEGTHPKITNVTATANSGSETNIGISCMTGARATLTNVTTEAYNGTNAFGLQTWGSAADPTLFHVTAEAAAGTTLNIGVRILLESAPTLRQVIATGTSGANARGVYISGTVSTVTLEGVTAVGNGASNAYGIEIQGTPTVDITQSRIEGVGRSIWNPGGTLEITSSRLLGNGIYNGGTVRLATSMLEGPITSGPSTCVGVYDPDFAAVDCTAPAP